MTPTLEDVLTVDGPPLRTREIAALFRQHQRSVQRLIADGTLPAVRLGRGRDVYVVSRHALRKYILDRAAVGGAPETK